VVADDVARARSKLVIKALGVPGARAGGLPPTGTCPAVAAVIVHNPPANRIGSGQSKSGESLGRCAAGIRIAAKMAIKKAIDAGAKGVKIRMSGRLNGVEIARTEFYAEGQIPLHTFRADIDFALAEAQTTYGKIGVKVWVNKGLVFKPAERSRAEASAYGPVAPVTSSMPTTK
jgi:hypothetical protein